MSGDIVVSIRRVPVERDGVPHTIQRIVAALLLVALLPLLLIIAVLVMTTSRGPAIFRQERVGRYGERFIAYKFRTMERHAERVRELILHLNEHDGILFKVRRDPRITKVGRILRRTSIDELPQLWNVVRGEMALIGPRPALPEEVERYNQIERRRLDVHPGLTGLWQVSGRSDLSWEQSVKLDVRYVEDRSVGLDLKILARTVGAVVTGRGAY